MSSSMALKIPSGRPTMPQAPPMQAAPPPMEPDADDQKGDGTAASGYVTPDLGPFECDNCVHFQAPTTCDQPQVVSDPEVGGQVDAKGCCNFFKSKGGANGAQEQPGAPDEGAATAAAATGGGDNAEAGGYA